MYMPELPEVETITRNLNINLVGQKLLSIDFLRKDIIAEKLNPVSEYLLLGESIIKVFRYGKYLLFQFTNNYLMIVHLRMTGKLLYLPLLSEEDKNLYLNHKHTHVIFNFSDGELLFNDVRRFGKIYFSKIDNSVTLEELLNSGPDALSENFSKDYLYQRSQKSPKKAIKTFLLDQKIVAGIGNIYADECLFLAAIKPNRAAASLTREESSTLHDKIIQVLEDSILSGGTTFSDYRTADNHKGNFQNKLFVYGRAGESCRICSNTLESIKIAGRTTVYCPKCQI
ncbi:DNA-formamidopyrimidine glycosylase [Fastidiosipila sanguinis]|uniref:Formamidopyrimidine-DNA glycosylase n=2 Tax=Fastidiosipila sanguinis TaxID=236753 RepID=A0A2S0KNR1_9FIRM|nr:DNA-formamidopyrimidine glycosylase [Fastidiosipila sanguinis]